MLDKIFDLDLWLFNKINRTWTSSYCDYFFPAITDLHTTPFFRYVFIPWLFFVFIRQYAWRGVLGFVGLALTIGLTDMIGGQIIKPSFQRERPATAVENSVVRSVHHDGFSFASNHAFNSMAAAVYLSAWIPQGRWLFYTLGFLVAYSRVYNGVHYPTDVICGMLFGFIIGQLMSRLSMFLILGKGQTARTFR